MIVGLIVGTVGGVFLYTAGWLSPHELTPSRFVDTFQELNGEHPGFRRNHAKGLGANGYFESNGRGARLSKAEVFKPGRIPVMGRFAFAGGMPYVNDAPETVRSLAIRFVPPNGEEWRVGAVDIPVFPVNTPESFHEQMLATAPNPATGKPDPAKVSAFFERHPESHRAVSAIGARTPSSGFDNATYNGLDAFMLVDEAGHSTPVRWSLVSVQPFAPVAPKAPPGKPNYLFDALIARSKEGPMQWRVVMTIGRPGDPTNDATVAWPEDREKIDVGTITIDGVEAEATSPVRTINFDPLVLPNGIAASDDPLLSARSAVYSQSVRRRLGEPESPSAVTPEEVKEVKP